MSTATEFKPGEHEEEVRRAHSHRTKHRARTRFDSWSGSYDRSILNYFLFRPSYLTMLEEIARWRVERREPFRLLDIGCGTASFAKLLLETGWPVMMVGIDYSPAMCALARAKMEVAEAEPEETDSSLVGGDSDPQGGIEPGVASIVAGDSEHLPFASGRFDIVTCANSFHHYPHQQSVVLEMHRVLRPGGRLILLDGFRDNVIGFVTYDVIVTWVEKHVHHASWAEIDAFMREAGFHSIRRRKVNVFCPILATVGEA